jgi:putative membrane protein
MQGYVWDTQSDMGLALLGAVLALVLLSRIHNNQLIELKLNLYLRRIGVPLEQKGGRWL